MKSYKNYEKHFIGGSDIASLSLVGLEESGRLKHAFLNFGMDGSYSAYIVDKDAEIGGHYKLRDTFYGWLRIYDDEELVVEYHGKEIKIYRAGEMGCIVQIND